MKWGNDYPENAIMDYELASSVGDLVIRNSLER